MKILKIAYFSYVLSLLALFIYSFTQVDLNLTLSRNSIYLLLEQKLQYIGFFQRPFSTVFFVTIAVLLFLHYAVFLYASKNQKMSFKNTFTLILSTVIVLVFSYNAFSYDFFNYIFDAKILTFYHQNPYLLRPLDFASDPMLSFMRWTHRVYPYGPSWLVLTAPLSFIGSNIFLLTFFLFKILSGALFVGCSFLIYKISQLISPKNKIFNTVFWSFNPLVIIEGLISSHNDFALVFFALLSIYLYLKKKKIYSIASLIFSIGIKYLSVVLIPVFLLIYYLERQGNKINWDKIFLLSVIFSLFGLSIATTRTTFQPWYLILPLALSSFISKKSYIFIPSLIASIFSVVIYSVYIYMTDYAPNYSQVISTIEQLGLISVVVITTAYLLIKRYA